jgi:hypothetical protein
MECDTAIIIARVFAVGIDSSRWNCTLAPGANERIAVEHAEGIALDGARHLDTAIGTSRTLVVAYKVVTMGLDGRPELGGGGFVLDPAPALPLAILDALVEQGLKSGKLVVHTANWRRRRRRW